MPETPAEAGVPDDPITDHVYDGIQEFDNPSPAWLNWVFWGTVGFGIVYFLVYHVFHAAPSVKDQYEQALAADKARAAAVGVLAMDEATLLKLMDDSQALASGNAVYMTYCAACHLTDGSGIVGPNLTDNHYKNLKTLAEIPQVVANGAGGGAMPPWKAMISNNDIMYVSAYVASLRGKMLEGTRGQEGEEIAPWPTQEGDVDAGAGAGAEGDAQ
jgi:cytochrome c oxidase cbb3-type subunit 3